MSSYIHFTKEEKEQARNTDHAVFLKRQGPGAVARGKWRIKRSILKRQFRRFVDMKNMMRKIMVVTLLFAIIGASLSTGDVQAASNKSKAKQYLNDASKDCKKIMDIY